jgi:hypothetical protein
MSTWREFVKKPEKMKNETLVEDSLDGSSNFNSWNSRLQFTLEEDDILSVIKNTLLETTTDEEKGRRCQGKENNHLLSKRSSPTSYFQPEDNL